MNRAEVPDFDVSPLYPVCCMLPPLRGAQYTRQGSAHGERHISFGRRKRLWANPETRHPTNLSAMLTGKFLCQIGGRLPLAPTGMQGIGAAGAYPEKERPDTRFPLTRPISQRLSDSQTNVLLVLSVSRRTEARRSPSQTKEACWPLARPASQESSRQEYSPI